MSNYNLNNLSEKQSTKHPLVSILLPVYNGSDYLEEAVQSILAQTYENFECIIINDGSTDESASIIQKFKDNRIRFYEQPNQGLAATLNCAIELSRGVYLARQDQDDISMPLRFEKQVAFLKTHPDCGMVGTWAAIWEEARETERLHQHPSENLILKFDLLFNNPFVHSSVMLRKKVFEEIGLYSVDMSRQPPEDYELWSRIARKFEVANIPEVLHIYREVPKSMSRTGINPFLDRIVNIGAENLAPLLERTISSQDAVSIAALFHGAYHRLDSKPHFKEIECSLLAAADKLSDSVNTPCGALRERAHDKFRSLKNRYLSYRYGKTFARGAALLDRFRGSIK